MGGDGKRREREREGKERGVGEKMRRGGGRGREKREDGMERRRGKVKKGEWERR